MPRAVSLVARAVSVLCVVLLVALVVFDAVAERFTAGLTPVQFSQRLKADLLDDYGRIVGVAHNAGDDVAAANEAVAHGVDAVEIDVTSVGGQLHASHDAPVPFLDTLFFRGPTLEEAWETARLRDTVVLHLKETSRRYLDQVGEFLRVREPRRVIFQTRDAESLRVLRRTVPSAWRLLLLFRPRDVERLRSDAELVEMIDGVSVRDSVLEPELQSWLRRRRLAIFAWTINDDRRMNELVERGVDGIITDRLDIMALLGGRREVPR